MYIPNIINIKYIIKFNMKLHNKNKEILILIKKNRVVTSSELAKYLKVSWNTADKYLLELAFEGKIERIKKKGVNLWLGKKG